MHAAFNLLTLTNNLAGRQFIMRDSIKRDNAKTNDKNRTAQTKSDTSSSDLSDLAVNTNSAAAMLRMQQTRGNQAVLRMLNKQGPSSHAAVQRSPLQRDDDDSTSSIGSLASSAASWVGDKAESAAKWGGIDTDNGFMKGVASIPGSRASNMAWDVAGLTPIGGVVITGVDLGESLIRSGQAAYNVATGDLDTADLRQKQATEDLQGAAVDATGMIPGYGEASGVVSLIYDATTSDPRDSASNQQIKLAKELGNGIIDQGNPFSPNPEWTAKDNERRRRQAGVGIPPDAEFSQDQAGKDTIVLTTNGKQHTYVWDPQQQKYVRAS